jgi:hypothetical protein
LGGTDGKGNDGNYGKKRETKDTPTHLQYLGDVTNRTWKGAFTDDVFLWGVLMLMKGICVTRIGCMMINWHRGDDLMSFLDVFHVAAL